MTTPAPGGPEAVLPRFALPRFRLLRARSAATAAGMLAAHPGAELLAGGQSLLPAMRQRLRTPRVLVDLETAGMTGIGVTGGVGTGGVGTGCVVVIGAMARQAGVERSAVVRAALPLLAHAASVTADPQVRHRGTIGGSLGQGDGTADIPTALVALHASVLLVAPDGERWVPVEQLWGTRRPEEVIARVAVPAVPGVPWAYRSLRHRMLDPAIVTVALLAGERPGVGLAGMAARPLRGVAAQHALARGGAGAEVAALADDATDPPTNPAGPAGYRRHLARTLLARALQDVRPE